MEWDDERVERWLRQSEGLERQLAPVSDLLFDAIDLRAGEAVLDVGCGTAPTTREAARRVGPTGRATGLDVSAPMLAAAASIAVDPGGAPVDWVEADAARWEPPPARYDAVISRFGVMFFDDPAAAFANLAAATRPGGRLAVAVWARRDDSELFALPLRTVLDALAARGVHPEEPADDEGPFSLHDDAAVGALLTSAGWAGVEVAHHDLALPFVGGVTPVTAAPAALDFGPTRLVTEALADDDRAAAVAALEERLGDHVDADGQVVLRARVHVVTAALPG